LNAVNTAAVAGKIALVDRGTCTFVAKAKMVQDAGAVGMILVNNVAGGAMDIIGVDPSVTIPTVFISQSDGNTLKNSLRTRSRTRSGMIATLGALDIRRGTDGNGRVLMFTPNPFVPGSSVAHYDTGALPNLLMEPAESPGQPNAVVPPFDLTYPLLQDLGW
jgi:hypothetical protein